MYSAHNYINVNEATKNHPKLKVSLWRVAIPGAYNANGLLVSTHTQIRANLPWIHNAGTAALSAQQLMSFNKKLCFTRWNPNICRIGWNMTNSL